MHYTLTQEYVQGMFLAVFLCALLYGMSWLTGRMFASFFERLLNWLDDGAHIVIGLGMLVAVILLAVFGVNATVSLVVALGITVAVGPALAYLALAKGCWYFRP